MARRYRNPPIAEAVCEFRLTRDTPWDLAIPGLLYERLRAEFPHREQRLFQEVELTQGPDGLQQQIRTIERIFLFSEDRKTFVQIGPRIVAVNCLRPYPGWQNFKPKIEMALGALCDELEAKRFEQIGLRYINRISVPSPLVKLEDYFQFYVFLGPDLPQEIGNFIAGCEFFYAEGRDVCRLQLTPAVGQSADKRDFLLDIGYSLAQSGEFERDRALDWIESAHTTIGQIFEGCITDRLRELFLRE
jgi:uncharacterized protein (TIGR04255 family)